MDKISLRAVGAALDATFAMARAAAMAPERDAAEVSFAAETTYWTANGAGQAVIRAAEVELSYWTDQQTA